MKKNPTEEKEMHKILEKVFITLKNLQVVKN